MALFDAPQSHFKEKRNFQSKSGANSTEKCVDDIARRTSATLKRNFQSKSDTNSTKKCAAVSPSTFPLVALFFSALEFEPSAAQKLAIHSARWDNPCCCWRWTSWHMSHLPSFLFHYSISLRTLHFPCHPFPFYLVVPSTFAAPSCYLFACLHFSSWHHFAKHNTKPFYHNEKKKNAATGLCTPVSQSGDQTFPGGNY